MTFHGNDTPIFHFHVRNGLYLVYFADCSLLYYGLGCRLQPCKRSAKDFTFSGIKLQCACYLRNIFNGIKFRLLMKRLVPPFAGRSYNCEVGPRSAVTSGTIHEAHFLWRWQGSKSQIMRKKYAREKNETSTERCEVDGVAR